MREIINLNFDWLYANSFKENYLSNHWDSSEFEEIDIPHTNFELPYNNFDEKLYQFESCYKRKLKIPKLKKNQRVILHFEGVATYAKVYIDGKYIGEHKGGYTPFEFDITNVINEENEITLYVDSNERKEIPPFGFVVDFLTYGGIYREVWLEIVPEIYIKNAQIKTSHELDKIKRFHVDLYVNKATGPVDIQFVLKKEDTIVFEETTKCSLNLKNKFSFEVENIQLWHINSPHLYHLEIILNNNDKKIFRFGFRKMEYKNSGFVLNGERIKLRGLNRHQSFPYVGYAMPKRAQRKDADILKYDLGLNTVRLSHYPQSKHFLDRCDEVGLLVFDEIPGWQHVSKNEEWRNLTLQHVREMIERDWNHPSIFIWGVRINESQDDDKLYRETNKLARELDSTRVTGGVRCIQNSNLLEDVYTYNDFIFDGIQLPLNKKKKVTKRKAPYLVTEFNGHMYPTKKFDDESKRVEHALRHVKVLDRMEGDSEISGAIGWCMFDYNTHKEFGSGDKICYHGVLDMYRIPKYAYYAYASQQSEMPVMEILSTLNNGDLPSSIRGNVYIFSNCDYIKLFINEKFIKDFKPRFDMFPNLAHPPFVIDDFIGNLIVEQEKFSKTDGMKIKELLQKADKKGANLPFLDMLTMVRLFLKYKLNMKDAEDLYTKYFGGWGQSSTTYRFEGYKNEKCVLVETKGQTSAPKLKMEVDDYYLKEDETYDVTRIVIKIVDEFNQVCVYGSDVFTIETDKMLRVIGPKVKSLIGGSVGFWVRTNGLVGASTIKIISERFGIEETIINIEE